MRVTSDVFAVDLQQKRDAAGLTQEQLASLVGYRREYVSAVENRRAPFPMRMAISCARIFRAPILAEQNGEQFVILPSDAPMDGKPEYDQIPNDEQLNDLDAAEHISNVRNRASDMVEATNLAERQWLAIRNGCAQGREQYVRCYAQAFSLKWAVDGFIEDGEKDRPHLVDQGRRIALGSRPGYEGGGDLEAA